MLKYKFSVLLAILLFAFNLSFCQVSNPEKGVNVISKKQMQEIFDEIKTPFKYGVVFKHPDSAKMIDSPTIFRNQK